MLVSMQILCASFGSSASTRHCILAARGLTGLRFSFLYSTHSCQASAFISGGHSLIFQPLFLFRPHSPTFPHDLVQQVTRPGFTGQPHRGGTHLPHIPLSFRATSRIGRHGAGCKWSAAPGFVCLVWIGCFVKRRNRTHSNFRLHNTLRRSTHPA